LDRPIQTLAEDLDSDQFDDLLTMPPDSQKSPSPPPSPKSRKRKRKNKKVKGKAHDPDPLNKDDDGEEEDEGLDDDGSEEDEEDEASKKARKKAIRQVKDRHKRDLKMWRAKKGPCPRYPHEELQALKKKTKKQKPVSNFVTPCFLLLLTPRI
jgi:hypothetical protein